MMVGSGLEEEGREALHPSCIISTVQASGGSVMIWGCFCWDGFGSATLCINKIKFPEYVSILSDHFIPSMDQVLPVGGSIFRDDDTRTYQARIVDNWFQEHQGSFRCLIWIPQSPDFNPIENL
ncbi:hypothetical protein AVEN_226871-1 [Araneus ventricosus]|uniref:Tc1-like transposase DDE domain-containing protein n=1 Tax=Araneus ventricosus TaxID=182803 RepID=A0A4Y2H8Q8_ARAVE|nr:hypothetical protein AVEN_226871-1 [Araneus ventricosus]